MRRVDRVFKGLSLALVYTMCLGMMSGSGGLMNPAQALAQAVYMKVIGDDDIAGNGTFLFGYVWPYPIFPFVGAVIAAAVFHLHRVVTNQELD